MTSNQSSTFTRDICGYSPAFWYTVDAVDFSARYIFTPMNLFITLPTDILTIIAFYKQRRQHSAIGYQVVASICETLVTLAFLGDQLSRAFAGLTGTSADWFTGSYMLMSFAAHPRLVLLKGAYTCSILMSTAVAADRVFAMFRPFAYKNINHKNHQVVAVLVCALLAFGASGFEFVRFTVGEKATGGYILILNSQFLTSSLGVFFANFRSFTIGAGFIILQVCNATAVALYQSRKKKVDQMSKSDSSEAKRKETEKMLIIICACEGCFTGLRAVAMIFNALGNAMWPGFAQCPAQLSNSMEGIIIELCNVLEFYTVFAISKRFRHMIFDALPSGCIEKLKKSQSTQSSTSTTMSRRAWVI